MDKIKNSYSLGEYLVQLSKTNDHLFIEIEAPGSGRMFFVELEDDAIHQVSQELFSNIQEMSLAFDDAIKKAYPEVSLAFNGSGKLTYRVGFSVGPIKKNQEFTIELQEKKIDALTMFERRVENRFEKLSQKIAFLEHNSTGYSEHSDGGSIHKEHAKLYNGDEDIGKRLDLLEKRMFDKFEVLEKRINSIEEETRASKAELQNIIDVVNRLENKILEKKDLSIPEPKDLDWRFDFLSPQAKNFEFSNSHKTACNINSLRSEIRLSKPLPKTGTTKIDLKIESGLKHIWFGFVTPVTMKSTDWYQKGIYFSTKTGAIYGNNKVIKELQNTSQGKGKEGDVLSFIVDMDQNRFSVQINGVQVNSVVVNSKNTIYFPYCGTSEKECKISIV